MYVKTVTTRTHTTSNTPAEAIFIASATFGGLRASYGLQQSSMDGKAIVKTKYASYRKILEKKADEVRRSMSAQKAAQVISRREDPHDEGDLSQQSHEEWIFLNRNTLDMKLLREVQDALRRIDQGTYGICYECEEAISPKRLDAVPWAKFCVSCQERIANGSLEERDEPTYAESHQ